MNRQPIAKKRRRISIHVRIGVYTSGRRGSAISKSTGSQRFLRGRNRLIYNGLLIMRQCIPSRRLALLVRIHKPLLTVSLTATVRFLVLRFGSGTSQENSPRLWQRSQRCGSRWTTIHCRHCELDLTQERDRNITTYSLSTDSAARTWLHVSFCAIRSLVWLSTFCLGRGWHWKALRRVKRRLDVSRAIREV